jgi:hypothetical protein
MRAISVHVEEDAYQRPDRYGGIATPRPAAGRVCLNPLHRFASRGDTRTFPGDGGGP